MSEVAAIWVGLFIAVVLCILHAAACSVWENRRRRRRPGRRA